jgi:hypothetical protein
MPISQDFYNLHIERLICILMKTHHVRDRIWNHAPLVYSVHRSFHIESTVSVQFKQKWNLKFSGTQKKEKNKQTRLYRISLTVPNTHS